ncbi:MAG: GNAT family N-acetyltransferase [Lachnospiraceae bacterium]|nr:GNAT family N-acetyltransferase [Lachnospiraceae bacterium]
MALAWRTFLRFESADYEEEGIRNFLDFITDPRLERMFLLGEYHMLVARAEGKIVGMVTLRNVFHISLLFVDADFQRQGIGKALIHAMYKKAGAGKLTVFASPYGIPFYHRIGFIDTGKEEVRDGIRYTPMIYEEG